MSFIGEKRPASSPTGGSRSPKRRLTGDPSSPMDITPEPLIKVSRFLKIGGGLHSEVMKNLGVDILRPEIEAFDDIVNSILSAEDTVSKTEAAAKLKLLVSKGHLLPRVLIMKSNVVPKLLTIMADHSVPNLQYMSISIIADIAMGKNIGSLLEKEAIGKIVDVICAENIESNDIKEEAVRALGNIAGDCEQARFLIIEEALSQLLTLYLKTSPTTDNVSLSSMIRWTIQMLYDGIAPSDMPYQDLIILVKELLLSKVSDRHKEAGCQTLYFMAQDPHSDITQDEAVMDAIENLLPLQCSFTPSLLKVFQRVMTPGLIKKVIPYLKMFLKSSETKVVSETCSTLLILSNVNIYAQDMFDGGVIQTLLDVSNSNQFSEDVKKLALSTISRITDRVVKVGSSEDKGLNEDADFPEDKGSDEDAD